MTAMDDRRELLDDLAQSQEAVEARRAVETLDDPYRTCEYGHHAYLVRADGGFRCENCGSTDPEGDSA